MALSFGNVIGGQGGGSDGVGDALAELVNAENSITGAETLTGSDFDTMHVCSGSSDYIVTLPAVSGNGGKWMSFRFTNTGMTTIDGNSTEEVHGDTSRYYMAGDFVTLYCDGSRWLAQQMLTPIGCHAYDGGDKTWAGGTAELDTEYYDHGSNFSTSTYKFTVPCTGYYRVYAHTTMDASVSAEIVGSLILYKNSFAQEAISSAHITQSSGYDATATIELVKQYQKDDTIFMYQSSSSASTIWKGGSDGETYMIVERTDRNF